jgi:hypothetical protein
MSLHQARDQGQSYKVCLSINVPDNTDYNQRITPGEAPGGYLVEYFYLHIFCRFKEIPISIIRDWFHIIALGLNRLPAKHLITFIQAWKASIENA